MHAWLPSRRRSSRVDPKPPVITVGLREAQFNAIDSDEIVSALCDELRTVRGKLGLPIELRSRQTKLRIRRRSAYARSHRHLMPRCRRDVLPVKYLRPQIPLQHGVKGLPRLVILRGTHVAGVLYFELSIDQNGVPG